MVVHDRLDRLLIWCGVVGPVLFVASFLINGALHPGYHPLRHPVSSLSLAPDAGWVQSVTFLVTGALLVACAVGMGRAGWGRWTPILLGLVGAGLIGAGIFACDPVNGYPVGTPVPAPRTLHGIVHDQMSTPVFTALPAACLVLGRRFGRLGERRWRTYSITTAVVFWLCFVLAALGFNGIDGFVPTGGLWQRLCLVVGLAWVVAVSLWLLRGGAPRAGAPKG